MKRRRAFPAHDWPRGLDAGPPQTCETCGAEWSESYESPPPWSCRRAPLESTGTLDRSKGLSLVSKSNSGREHQKDEAYREWIRGLPCVGCGAEPPNEAAHFRTRGAGWGDWTDGGNLYPACRRCHREQHDRGIETVQREWCVNLPEITTQLGRQYRQRESGARRWSGVERLSARRCCGTNW